MEKVVKLASKLPQNKREDGFVDRLSSRYTVLILTIFALTLTVTSWVRKPMHCWFPKYVTKYQRRYGHSYCWVADTYYLPYTDYIPREHEDDKRRMIRYYQWLPWILLAQAFLFWFPSVIWKQLNSKAGIDASDVLGSARLLQNTQKLDKRESRLKMLGNMFDRFLKAREEHGSGCKECCSGLFGCLVCQCSGRRVDCYLVCLYIVSKIFYLGNIIFQLFALSGILNVHFEEYGKEYINFYHGNNSTGPQQQWNSPIFPRISMCDIKVRYLGNLQRHTVQCILPLNFYAEKMYLFFWFWMIFLIAVTGFDILLWFLRAVLHCDRINFIRNHLNAGGRISSEKRRIMAKLFMKNYLGHDGVFLLRLIAHNTNTITTTDIIGTLWDAWAESEIPERDSDSDEGTPGDTLQLNPRYSNKELTAAASPGEPRDRSHSKPSTRPYRSYQV